MASGLTHTFATVSATALGTAYFGLDHPVAAVAWSIGGLWCIVVQPDLDQIENGGYYGQVVIRNTVARFEKLWMMYWMPYAVALKHRSFFSHFPFIGSSGRLIYGGWWYLPLLPLWSGTPFFLTAVFVMDILHWIMDWRIWTILGIFKQRKNA